MLYASTNLALCCLEVLVHMKRDRIPVEYVWSTALLPDAPEQFDDVWPVEDTDRTRAFGKWWIERVSAVAIAVPSVIIPNTPTDFHVLLNRCTLITRPCIGNQEATSALILAFS